MFPNLFCKCYQKYINELRVFYGIKSKYALNFKFTNNIIHASLLSQFSYISHNFWSHNMLKHTSFIFMSSFVENSIYSILLSHNFFFKNIFQKYTYAYIFSLNDFLIIKIPLQNKHLINPSI